MKSGPKKKKPAGTRDDPAQSKRFIDAAREFGADETPEGAANAFRKVTQNGRKKGKERR